EVRGWVEDERRRAITRDKHGPTRTGTDFGGGAKKSSSVFVRGSSVSVRGTSVSVGGSPCRPPSSSQLVANAALSLLNLCCHLLDRQLAAQAEAFEKEGGFTERLYRIRINRRQAEHLLSPRERRPSSYGQRRR
ncbi:hypothetical protein FJY63_04255, partial [Candidatus Sumerlaeota bacterium]|nr:hypothetical protein [Candidatus Sumerlaeota bacterium]